MVKYYLLNLVRTPIKTIKGVEKWPFLVVRINDIEQLQ